MYYRNNVLILVTHKPPELTPDERMTMERHQRIQELERQARVGLQGEANKSKNNNDSGKGGSESSSDVPNIGKHFEYERHAGYPWNSQSGYEPVPPSEALDGRKDIYEAPWGRHYTSHAIDRTLPKALGPHEVSKPEKPGRQPKFEWGGRSIPPDIVEYVIAYGSESSYARNPQHKTYKLGDVEVGVGSDGKTVVHAKYQT